MIDQERVREMTKLATYEKREGKMCYQVTHYYRGDFVSRHLIKGFFSATAAFGFMLLLWGVYHMETLIENLDTMDLLQFANSILVKYLFFLAVYLLVVDIYANVTYAVGKRGTKYYYRHLKRLEKLYSEQDR